MTATRCIALGLVLSASGCSGRDGAASALASPASADVGTARSSATSPWVKARSPAGLSLLEVPAEVQVSPESNGAVVAPFPARVMRIFVRAGEKVAKGQPVASVVMPQLVEAAGHYAAARTRVNAYRARRDQLEKLRSEGLAKSAEIAEVETHVAEALADQQATEATIRSAGIELATVPSLLAGGGVSVLRSPVDGLVVEVNAALGEMREGAGKPIARVVGEGAPRIQARTAHRLPPGARFAFTTAVGERTPATLLSQSPAVDPRDGTRLSWFEVPRSARLAQGQTGRLQIVLGDAEGVCAVPAAAVALDGNKTYVTVRDGQGGDATRRVEVEVLATSGADALVRGPLKPGTEVAAEGQGPPTPPSSPSLPGEGGGR